MSWMVITVGQGAFTGAMNAGECSTSNPRFHRRKGRSKCVHIRLPPTRSMRPRRPASPLEAGQPSNTLRSSSGFPVRFSSNRAAYTPLPVGFRRAKQLSQASLIGFITVAHRRVYAELPNASAWHGSFPGSMFKHARMHLCGILPAGQLVKQLFVLVSDLLPTIDGPNTVGRAPPIIFRQLRLALDQIDLGSEIAGIAEKQSVFAQHLSIERVLMGQDAVSETERLQ